MKNKEKKKLTLDEYIDIGKSDIIVYVSVTLILLIIFLYVAIKYNVYYYLFFVGLITIGRSFERIETFATLKQIKKT